MLFKNVTCYAFKINKNLDKINRIIFFQVYAKIMPIGKNQIFNGF